MEYLQYLKTNGMCIGFSSQLGVQEAMDIIKFFGLYQKKPEPITIFLLEDAIKQWKKIYKDPEDGGCWFCYTESEDMIFDTEFDTNVHKKCLEKVLEKNPEHPEAELMKYLLEEE